MRISKFRDELAQDVRYALRTMRRDKAFAAASVVLLSLGIGATTAIFWVAEALVFKALPVDDPARLVQLEQVQQGKAVDFFSYPKFQRLRERKPVFLEPFAWATRSLDLGIGDQVEPVEAMFVSGNYHAALGVQALLGRTITTDDDEPRAAPVAVISHACWRQRFGMDPGVLGRWVRLQGLPVTVVGVMPPWFFGTEVGRSSEITVPLHAQPLLAPKTPLLQRPSVQWLRIMARLTRGASIEQARAELRALWRQILPEADPQGHRTGVDIDIRIRQASRGSSQLREQFSTPLLTLMAAAALLLLIVCANVASLMVARASTRVREMAVRLAVGGSRSRLVSQLLTESLVLAVFGGAAGLFVAYWGSGALISLLSTSPRASVHLEARPDLPVLGFVAAATLLTAILFGLAPALWSSRVNVGEGLRGGGSSMQRTRSRIGKTLAAAQVALRLVLLVSAGLIVRSLANLLTVAPGFRTKGVLLAQLSPARPATRTPL